MRSAHTRAQSLKSLKRHDHARSPRDTSRSSTLLISLIPISLILMMLSAASAWAHQCRFYRNDKRNLCLAKNESRAFYCSFIQDPDQQRYCYAYVERTPGQCASITDEALKAQCDVEAKARAEEAEAQRKLEEERRAAQEAQEAAAQGGAGQPGAGQPGAAPPAPPAGGRP